MGEGTQESIAGHLVAAAAVVPYDVPQAVDREGRFELVELVGVTARSWVYKARDTRLSSAASEQQVAVKISRRRVVPGAGAVGEAQWGAAVDHPAVVRMIDAGVTRDGLPYAVMEWMDGPSLATAPRPDLRTRLRWLADLAGAVQAAHSAGVIHCDIKPQNVMLDHHGRPRLTDFDLAMAEAGNTPGLRGTLAYMAPEQFRREPGAHGPRADVYGLGALAFELFAGRPPHGSVPEYVQAALLSGAVAPVAEALADVPKEVRDIVSRALHPVVAKRYQTALELAADIDRYLTFQPIDWQRPSPARRAVLWCRRRPARVVIGVAAVLVALASGIAWVAVARQEAAMDRQAAQEARRLASLEINRFSDSMQQVMRGAYQSVPLLDPDQGPIIALALTDWLADSPLFTEYGIVLAVPERRTLLVGFLAKAEGQPARPSLAAAAARLALAELDLLDNQPASALASLEILERVHLATLSPTDPAHRVSAALRLCALVALAPKAADKAPHRAALRALWSEMEADVRVPRSVKVRMNAAMVGRRGEK
jgi:tRNA A-37 threonylcarbamoyl transferase component Bud32